MTTRASTAMVLAARPSAWQVPLASAWFSFQPAEEVFYGAAARVIRLAQALVPKVSRCQVSSSSSRAVTVGLSLEGR